MVASRLAKIFEQKFKLLVMNFKLLRAAFCTAVLLNLVHAPNALAQASSNEGGGNLQTPVQVIVQIAAAAVVLRVLAHFNLP